MAIQPVKSAIYINNKLLICFFIFILAIYLSEFTDEDYFCFFTRINDKNIFL